MYMSLWKDRGLICEVEVYAEKNHYQRPEEDKWHIEINSHFNIQNLLDLYENDYVGASYFREDIGSIQKYRFDYNEGHDIDFPKPQSYTLDDPKFNKDKNQIIEVIRKRLQHFAQVYNLAYKED